MSIISGLIAQQFASRQGLDDSNKFLLLGWVLGSNPVGLGITLALVKKEVNDLPPPPADGYGKESSLATTPGSTGAPPPPA